jgi:hypothetical protein
MEDEAEVIGIRGICGSETATVPNQREPKERELNRRGAKRSGEGSHLFRPKEARF